MRDHSSSPRNHRLAAFTARTLLAGCVLLVAAASTLIAQPLIVGEYTHDVRESAHPYSGVLNEGVAQLVHTETIYSPNATYIAPHFAKFDLAPGDWVIVRSPDGAQSWRYEGYGRKNLGVEGGFFATHIKGDTAIIELYSQSSAGGYGYKMDYYGRGWSDAEIADMWLRGVNEKVNLPEPFFANRSICVSGDWTEAGTLDGHSDPNLNAAHDTSRAVARIIFNGSAHCTGWLIGDEGHLMTNEHCITSQAQTNSMDFEFMAEGTSCQSSLACPGTIEASGGTFITDDSALDYALILPDTSTGTGTDLVGTYGRFQLRDTLPAVGEPIFHPQHPAGWGKQIVYTSDYPDDAGDHTSFPGNAKVSSITEVACSGGPGDIGYWSDTQGGSSGSPVVAWSDHKVVALHHCRGSAFCSSGNPANDDRNRGVPIPAVIADLGADLPAGAVCNAPAAPTSALATPNGDNRIDVTWSTPPRGTVEYNVERALGTCASNDGFVQIAGNATSPYADTTPSGGSSYAYRVRAYDTAEVCSSLPSNCSEATTTGVCTLAPDFAGLDFADSAGTTQCSTTLGWTEVSDRCGGVGNVVYNVYRSETPGFVPGPSNMVDSCVVGDTWSDPNVLPGFDYHYIVRAEDNSGNGSGPCRGGNEDTNVAEMSASPGGPPQITFADDVESGGANFVAEAGPNDPGTTPFSIVDTDSNSPIHSWFVAEISSVKDQTLRTSSSIALPASGGALLTFWHHHDTEATYDGGVLEISTDGGTTWLDILDGNANRFLTGGYNSTLATGFSNPLPGRAAWSGDSAGFIETVVDLDDFAGQTVQLRWRFGCDSSVSDVGWWIDDFEISTATECTAPNIFTDGFESGDTSVWSRSFP